MYNEDIAEIKEQLAQVSKISAELNTAKYLRKLNKRNIIILILSILLIISLCFNLHFLLAYEKVTETTETITTTFEGVEQVADNNGNNNIVGGDYYGKATN